VEVLNACTPSNATEDDDWRTGRYTTLDVPPPGAGFVTVTHPVPAFATSEGLIVAVKSVLEITLVNRGERFQLSTAVGANPVPVTVNVNAPLPGATLGGLRDRSTNGIAFDWAKAIADKLRNRQTKQARFMRPPSHQIWVRDSTG
jgi:hypothetical protein